MKHVRLRFCLCLVFALGLLSVAWAKTDTVPAPNGTDDTSNIQTTINGAASGDTISFSSGGQYKVSSTITLLSNLSYTGNGCTLNWIATSGGALFYMNGVTNLTISGFTFNGSAYGGGIRIDANPNLSSDVTITNNTIENNSYANQTNWPFTCGICDQGLIDSSITYNTIENISGGVGILIYEASNDTFSNNTFSNLVTDCLQIGGLNGTTGSGLVFQYNVGTNNCNGCGIEIGDGADTSYPTSTNMLINGNVFAEGSYDDGKEMSMSIVNAGTGTVISNNNLTMSNPQSFATCLEFASDQQKAENAQVINNIIHDAPWATLTDGDYNQNILWDYNLFVNIANSPVWGDGTTNNCGGAADQYLYNWAYGCSNNLSSYPNNYNMSGSCPTLGIAETANAIVGGANGVFTITSSVAPAQNTAIYYTLSGTGVNGTDYTITPASPATLTAGQTSTTLSVHGLTSGKSVIATLAFGPYYINSSAKTATVTITAGSGGSLSGGTASASTSTYNLTSLGTTDWSHWNNTGWIHKSAGGSQISNVTQFGGGTYGNYDVSSRNVSWTDGTPTGSNSDDQYYIYCQNKANAGWTFTVPAGTSSQTLAILWGGVAGASVKLNAHLSDGSAPDYTNALTIPGSNTITYLETLSFHAASVGQTLTITLTNVSGTAASVDLDAAWLMSTATGALSGSTATASTSTYNLTSLGTTDWSHWNGSGWIHKSAGGSQISNVTQIGGGSYGNYYDSVHNVSWTDGTPTTSNSDDQYYYWCNTAQNSGWTFTVPAGTASHTLYVMWGGAAGAGIKLNAHLSDGSAADYTDAFTCGGSTVSQLETITYHAASASQTLTITLSKTDSSAGPSVDLDAAWLQ